MYFTWKRVTWDFSNFKISNYPINTTTPKLAWPGQATHKVCSTPQIRWNGSHDSPETPNLVKLSFLAIALTSYHTITIPIRYIIKQRKEKYIVKFHTNELQIATANEHNKNRFEFQTRKQNRLILFHFTRVCS